jgi:hypothetical protein
VIRGIGRVLGHIPLGVVRQLVNLFKTSEFKRLMLVGGVLIQSRQCGSVRRDVALRALAVGTSR